MGSVSRNISIYRDIRLFGTTRTWKYRAEKKCLLIYTTQSKVAASAYTTSKLCKMSVATVRLYIKSVGILGST